VLQHFYSTNSAYDNCGKFFMVGENSVRNSDCTHLSQNHFTDSPTPI